MSDTEQLAGPADNGQAPPPADPPTSSLAGEDLVNALASARREAAGHRVKNKELVAQLEAAQPLIASAKEAAAEARQLKVDLALADAFHRKGLKPDYTRSHLALRGLMQGLDPTVPDFKETVDDMLDEEAQRVPELREQRSSGPVGAEFPGQGHVSSQLTRFDLSVMEPDEVVAALKSNKLDALLGRNR